MPAGRGQLPPLPPPLDTPLVLTTHRLAATVQASHACVCTCAVISKLRKCRQLRTWQTRLVRSVSELAIAGSCTSQPVYALARIASSVSSWRSAAWCFLAVQSALWLPFSVYEPCDWLGRASLKLPRQKLCRVGASYTLIQSVSQSAYMVAMWGILTKPILPVVKDMYTHWRLAQRMTLATSCE